MFEQNLQSLRLAKVNWNSSVLAPRNRYPDSFVQDPVMQTGHKRARNCRSEYERLGRVCQRSQSANAGDFRMLRK